MIGLSCRLGFHSYVARRVGAMLVLSYCRRCDRPLDERNPWPTTTASARGYEGPQSRSAPNPPQSAGE